MALVNYAGSQFQNATDRKRRVQSLAREHELRVRRAVDQQNEARVEAAMIKRRALREQALATRSAAARRADPIRLVLITSALFFIGLGGLYLVDVARSLY
jgi:hypothetical protein